ncbi:hypothetical protein ACFSBG_09055 [Georgenia yuyongxinii]|uniref:hypothetical protein n=1 Tax=Georgenia yuyongxinii TaxID=2589797 RepID=UPI00143DC18E|nr:hypothetical protein [Georgenia yuyongxinii]
MSSTWDAARAAEQPVEVDVTDAHAQVARNIGTRGTEHTYWTVPAQTPEFFRIRIKVP